MLCPRSVLITGSNRGIGLELVKQFLKLSSPPQHVFAACRNPDSAQALQELVKENKSVKIIRVDANELGTVETAKAEVEATLKDDGLNLLINNAGYVVRDALEEVKADDLIQCYKVNVSAPVMMAQAFLPLLKKAAAATTDSPMSCSRAAIINMSTGVASIGENDTGGRYSYRCSKAGLNMATKSMSLDLKEAGILVTAIHPGWVQTDMGGPRALITTEESVTGIMERMASLQGQDSTGRFFHQNGREIAW